MKRLFVLQTSHYDLEYLDSQNLRGLLAVVFWTVAAFLFSYIVVHYELLSSTGTYFSS